MHDDFNDGNANGWEEHLGSGGSWSVQNGEYRGTAIKNTPEYLPTYSVIGDENWNDYRFNVKIYGEAGIDKTVLFRYHSMQKTYRLAVISSWPDWYGDEIFLTKQFPNPIIVAGVKFVNQQQKWYQLSIELQGQNIKVFIDNSETPLLEYNDGENPILTGKIGVLTEPGSYGGYGSVTINRFDDVLVTSLEPSPTPTPTMTPTPTPLPPLVLLPGLGASWNHEAMILDQPREPEDWYMTPGVKVYDGLIQTLENAGYVLGENLFIFNYDWRKPVEEIANDLKVYIGRHPPPPSGKIDLVGHSLGGLVARTYVQENPGNQIDQLITAGSPHKGTVKTYYLWEGAELNKALSGWQRIGAGILLQLKKKNFENNVETIKQAVPVLKNLLPTFSYLREDGTEKPLEEMDERNTWLENLNNLPLPEPLLQVLNTFVGVKENSTLRFINVQDRNELDRLLGKWVDGKPVSEENATGDDTVLDFSASLDNAANVVNLPGLDHGDLVETVEGQQKIMEVLGLSPSEIIPAPEITYEPSLVFEIASPANLTVFDPNNQLVAENQKLVFVSSPIPGNYRIEVNQEGLGGHYRLLVGRINSSGDIWTEEEGETSPTQPQTHIISYNPDPLQSKLQLAILARDKLNEAKDKAQGLKRPLKILLAAAIEKRIKEVDRIIFLLNQGKKDRAQTKIREAIFSISILEKNFKFLAKLYKLTPENQEEFRILFRQAKDYLVQAYELK
ncbi:MAG: esterase/lipase family protein [Patescibacteria group bacterium]